MKIAALKVLLERDGNLGFYYDVVDDLIRFTMVDHLKDLANPEWDSFETPENKAELRKAFTKVLKFYTTKKEFEQHLKDIYVLEGGE
ncbi:hypothetical protein UFOVP3_11 [uncultured Caudovirales phage]|uniref:Uncharacterized protein n=1 Tax=uncultured Caudovirales phage TaxID=2100421 RepID=A0A6J5TAL3_9CAUD|nr:hypothetical protein UFOVP3_11 [uncultured Caudovirales phage]